VAEKRVYRNHNLQNFRYTAQTKKRSQETLLNIYICVSCCFFAFTVYIIYGNLYIPIKYGMLQLSKACKLHREKIKNLQLLILFVHANCFVLKEDHISTCVELDETLYMDFFPKREAAITNTHKLINF